jgi:hypothetical protein
MRLNYHHQGHPRLLRQYGRIIPARPQPGTTNANFLRFHKYTLLVHANGNHTAQEDLARVLYHVLESPSHLVAGDPQPWLGIPREALPLLSDEDRNTDQKGTKGAFEENKK